MSNNDDAPGATHVIRCILKDYRQSERYPALSGGVYSRSTTTLKSIHEQINIILASTVANLPWDSFDAYSQGVVQLEKVLLAIYFKTLDAQRLYVPEVNDVLGGVAFITAFMEDRKMLMGAMEDLKKVNFKGLTLNFDDDYDRQRLQDDAAALTALFTFFRDYQGAGKMTDQQIPDRGKKKPQPQPIADMRFALRNIQDILARKPPVADFSEKIIRSLMLISIPLTLLDESRQDSKLVGDDTKNRLKLIKIWFAAQNLVIEIFKNARGPTLNLQQIDEKYDALLELLLAPPDATLLELIKLSTSIRRPFHARAVAFVRILGQLDEELDANKPEEFQQIMLKLTNALKAVQNDLTDVRGIVLDNGPLVAHAQVLDDLLVATRECIVQHGLEWDTNAREFQNALAIDVNHLNMMKKNYAQLFG